MPFSQPQEPNQHAIVSSLKLGQLVHAIRNKRPDISIRCRLMGQMWQPHFCRIVHVNGHAIMLKDESAGELIIIKDIFNVMQFELDHSYSGLEPNSYYDINIFE